MIEKNVSPRQLEGREAWVWGEQTLYLPTDAANDLPLKARGKLWAFYRPTALQRFARLAGGTKYVAKIAGFALGKHWGIFLVFRRLR